MKPALPFVRSLLCAWLIVSVAGIMAVPFLSRESLAGLTEAFHSMQKFFLLGFLAILAGYCVWRASPRTPEMYRSRDVCKDAYEALYRHFSEHALEGAHTETCRQLQDTLEAELNRHCWFYSREIRHPDIRRYRRYLQQIRDARSVC